MARHTRALGFIVGKVLIARIINQNSLLVKGVLIIPEGFADCAP